MSEQPGALFGALVTIAAAASGLLLGGLALLGPTGIANILITLIGALSACVFFLTQLQAVPLASLALVVAATGSVIGVLRTIQRYRQQRRVTSALPLRRIDDVRLIELAETAGANAVYVAQSRRATAFCIGLVRPRVVITTGLLNRLSPDEQEAVIWHEAHHVRLREPLRCFAAEMITSAFFWLPALRDLSERYRLVRELDADRHAITHTSRRALAGALHEVIAEPGFAGAIGLADAAAARIDRLFDPTSPLPPVFRSTRVMATAAALGGLGLVLATSLRLSVDERSPLDSMLLSTSLHGFPGMVVGLAINTAILLATGLGVARIRRRGTTISAPRRH